MQIKCLEKLTTKKCLMMVACSKLIIKSSTRSNAMDKRLHHKMRMVLFTRFVHIRRTTTCYMEKFNQRVTKEYYTG